MVAGVVATLGLDCAFIALVPHYCPMLVLSCMHPNACNVITIVCSGGIGTVGWDVSAVLLNTNLSRLEDLQLYSLSLLDPPFINALVGSNAMR